MTIAFACIGLLGLLLFGLGFAVSAFRARTDRVEGTSGDPAEVLHKLVRAHGNTSEYAAMLAVLIYLVGSHGPTTWGVTSMIGATASRYLIAMGIVMGSTLAKPNPLRFVGALGTYVFGIALSVSVLMAL